MRTATDLPIALPLPARASFFSTVNASTCVAAIGLGLLFLALRWQTFNAPLIRDEGEYAYAAQWLMHGELPYEHSFLQKPPMVVYTYALANILAPDVFWMPRILAALSVAASTLLLGYIARLEFGPTFVFPAMWLFTPMVLMPKLDQSAANTEMFMLLPLMGVFAIYARDRHYGASPRTWLLAGALTAATLLYKYTVFPLLAFLWVYWLLEKRRTSQGWSQLGRLCGFAAGGFLLTAGVILAPFLVHDGGRRLWECTMLFNRAYTGTGTFGLDPFYVRMSGFWKYWRVLCILPLLLLVKEPVRLRFWLKICAAAFVATGASIYSQYYVLVMPFWAMICAVAVVNLLTLLPKSMPSLEVWSRRIFTAAVVVATCLPDLPFMMPGGWQVAKFNPANPFPESLIAARRVAESTRPDDRVYVAGSEPQILYYARRNCSTRFIIAYPFMMATALAEKYQLEAVEDLKKHPPAVVVAATSNSSWLDGPGSPLVFRQFFWAMIAKDYECLGGYVLGPKGGQWLEPLPPNQNADQVSLTLFRRKAGRLE